MWGGSLFDSWFAKKSVDGPTNEASSWFFDAGITHNFLPNCASQESCVHHLAAISSHTAEDRNARGMARAVRLQRMWRRRTSLKIIMKQQIFCGGKTYKQAFSTSSDHLSTHETIKSFPRTGACKTDRMLFVSFHAVISSSVEAVVKKSYFENRASVRNPALVVYRVESRPTCAGALRELVWPIRGHLMVFCTPSLFCHLA